MSKEMTEYRALQAKLFKIPLDSDEGDQLLEKMDEVWWRLSENERNTISTEVPNTGRIERCHPTC